LVALAQRFREIPAKIADCGRGPATSDCVELKEMEGHATNVHYFGGMQFQQFGLHHVEIFLENELRLRFSLPVVRVIAAQPQ
jgi:hypothetical protein